ncbi:MAG: hypothetical protein J6W64_05795 [Bacilli bacterium]|nr:hypothetical protein [Bacilli bacterium]
MVPPPDWEGFAEFNFATTIDDDEINNILPWWYTNIYTPIDDRALIK